MSRSLGYHPAGDSASRWKLSNRSADYPWVPMRSYHGEVTIIAASGDVIGKAVATFEGWEEPGGLRRWGGRLEGGDQVLVRAYEAPGVAVRLPSGRTGELIVTNYGTGTGSADVTGSGPAPF